MYHLPCSQTIRTESFYLLTQHLPTQQAYCIPITQPQLLGMFVLTQKNTIKSLAPFLLSLLQAW